MTKVKGVLIDSGRVLNISATGSWSYSPNFFEIVGKDKFDSISKNKRDEAFKKAWGYINSIAVMKTIEDEWKHFSQFFTIIARELPELKISDEKKKLLTDDLVLNFDKYIFFKDVFEVIPRLSKNYKLCLVSDAWPSLRGVYKKAGLDKYFTSMVISSQLGVTKPDEKMYKSALLELGLNEDEVIFIDDSPKNCNGADKLGIRSIILDRVFKSRIYSKFILKTKFRMVKDLYELEKVI